MKMVIKSVKQTHSKRWCVDNHSSEENKFMDIEFTLRELSELNREPKEGYKIIDAKFVKLGKGWGRIPFQKVNNVIKVKSIKKGHYIEVSNKPYYCKVRIYLSEFN